MNDVFDALCGLFWRSRRVRRVWMLQANHGWRGLAVRCAAACCTEGGY